MTASCCRCLSAALHEAQSGSLLEASLDALLLFLFRQLVTAFRSASSAVSRQL